MSLYFDHGTSWPAGVRHRPGRPFFRSGIFDQRLGRRLTDSFSATAQQRPAVGIGVVAAGFLETGQGCLGDQPGALQSVVRINPDSNPQVASRLARSFERWAKFDAGRQAHARAALQRIRDHAGLSRDVRGVVSRALN